MTNLILFVRTIVTIVKVIGRILDVVSLSGTIPEMPTEEEFR